MTHLEMILKVLHKMDRDGSIRISDPLFFDRDQGSKFLRQQLVAPGFATRVPDANCTGYPCGYSLTDAGRALLHGTAG
jgi:hypothetical protein